MGLANSFRGTEGKITLPGVGALIGEMFQWQAWAIGKETYGLRAGCNILHESLWEASEGERRIELRISRDRWFEARPEPDARIERKGTHFTIKPVRLIPM